MAMIVAGLMSGTSCDGIDVAVAEFSIDGADIRMQPLGSTEMAMPVALQQQVRRVIAGEPFPALAFCQLDTLLGQSFADALVDACDGMAGVALRDIALVCSHGQTLWHWEEAGTTRGTLQSGNPAWIAERTGIPVISDLRMRDVAAGGNGAPLVSLFDAMLAAGLSADAADSASSPLRNDTASIGFLNLGGIANLTVVSGAGATEESAAELSIDEAVGSVLAYDIGPANALIDLAVARFTQGQAHCDRDGAMAAAGTAIPALLQRLRAHPYYALALPRSTGKETFGLAYLERTLADSTSAAEDVVATLTAHSAGLVIDAVREHAVQCLVISGGGAANPVLWQTIQDALPDRRILAMDALGIGADAKEAYAFALLGFMTLHGLPGIVGRCTGARHPSVLGNFTPGADSAALLQRCECPQRPWRLRIV